MCKILNKKITMFTIVFDRNGSGGGAGLLGPPNGAIIIAPVLVLHILSMPALSHPRWTNWNNNQSNVKMCLSYICFSTYHILFARTDLKCSNKYCKLDDDKQCMWYTLEIVVISIE